MSERLTEAAERATTYASVREELRWAGGVMATLSEMVQATCRHVERCARGVDRLADQMEALEVDAETVTEHRDAAEVMRKVLEIANVLGPTMQDVRAQADAVVKAHEREYGSIVEQARAVADVAAKSAFYSNR